MFGPFFRVGDSPEIIRQVKQTGELRGGVPRNIFQSDIPKVKAYEGQLPLTMTRGLAKPVARIRLEPSEISARLGIEFETAADDLDRLQAAVLRSGSGL